MFGDRVRRGAGEGGHNVSRDDCEYAGVDRRSTMASV